MTLFGKTNEAQSYNPKLVDGKGYFNDFHEFAVKLDDNDDKFENHVLEDEEDLNDEGYYAKWSTFYL